MSDPQSPFAGMKEVSREQNSSWYRPGAYLVRVDVVKWFNKKCGEVAFKSEVTVIQVINDGEGGGNRLGEQISHVIPKGGFKFLERVKGFIACATNSEDEDVDDEATLYACGDTQPLAGYVLQVSARNTPTKKHTAEKPAFFTNINYETRIPFEDVPELIGADGMERFFPNGLPGQAK